ncbi:MAG TPA: aromatic ring-hydroxylating dioxygenase subunit alpha [Alphaproteobacteria bacterium]|nr:aromatic ring-hydroxylating dioxygenase subunit alpha [Alphaproteobacteria bacterium]
MAQSERSGSGNGKIAALIAAQPQGHALRQAFYADPDVFAREIERLFIGHWLCAGHESSAPNAGDYFVVEIASESAIVVRGEDGRLRAFANVCRHRGSRIATAASGNARYLVCPYHAWTYGLDGGLRAARHMPADFDKSTHGLKPVNLRVIEGIVLISFAAMPLGLGHMERTVGDCFGPYEWTRVRIAHRERYPIAANWKLAVENYLECYHCSPSHPEYSRFHALEQPLPRIEKLNARMRERAEALGVDIPAYDHWVPSADGEEAVRGFRYALYDGVETGSMDGKAVAPLLGRFNGFDGGVTSIHLGPASFLVSYTDHGVIYRFVPRTVATCEMEVIWLVRADAREGVDYDPGRLTWLWKVTSEEDKRIVEDNQLGINSRYYEPGPYAPMEHFTNRFVEWYLGEIA